MNTFKHPEFLKAFHSYLTVIGYKSSYADAVIEVFENLDLTNLPKYSFKSFEDIVSFEKQVLGNFWNCIDSVKSEALGKKCIKDYAIPLETAVEYEKILKILQKYKCPTKN